MTRIDETAFAKVNLDLRVCCRRADGYHDLDSLVAFATIGDRLNFKPDSGLALTIDGPFGSELAGDDDNLVLRAARALADMLGRPPYACITLEKRLPIASGLGGGSADAAATLRGLARLWETSLTHANLFPLARRLGADVPVCLDSMPVRMRGIGDRLTPIDLPEPCPMLLVNPKVAVSTPTVFRALETMSGERDQTSVSDEITACRNTLLRSTNDLEAPAIRITPVIAEVIVAIEQLPGCTLARMSGSGATCFGLFEDEAGCARAAETLSAAHPDWWVMQTACR